MNYILITENTWTKKVGHGFWSGGAIGESSATTPLSPGSLSAPAPGFVSGPGLLLCWEEVRSSFFLFSLLGPLFFIEMKSEAKQGTSGPNSVHAYRFLPFFLSLSLFVCFFVLRWALSIEPWLFWNILHRPVWHWTQRDPPASPLKCWNQRPMPTTPGLHHDFLRFTCSESVWNTLKRKKARQT